jgi:hypothetical protein
MNPDSSLPFDHFRSGKKWTKHSGVVRLATRNSMNLKATLASTGCILISALMACAQSVGKELPGECGLDRNQATNTVRARLACGEGVEVKVGFRGGIWTSTDGTNWIPRQSGIVFSLYAVAHGNGAFVAVGNEGALLSSNDGIAWTIRDSGTDERLRGIAFGNGMFVAVGYAGTVITSKDGARWTVRNPATEESLESIALDQGTFVALGRKGTVLTSRKGTRWTARDSRVSAYFHNVKVAAPQ